MKVPRFMIVLIPYNNLLNLSWISKCLFLRNMEPFTVILTIKPDLIVRSVVSDLGRHCLFMLFGQIVNKFKLVVECISSPCPPVCSIQI